MFFSSKVPPKVRSIYKKDTISGMLGAVTMGITGPFIAVIARKYLHASAFEVGVITTVPVAGSLFTLVWANMMEGRRKMPYMTWAAIVARSMLILMAFSVSSKSYVFIIALYYFIMSICAPAYNSLMKELYPDGDRARIMSYVRVCVFIIYLVVIACSAKFLGGHNYRIAFPIAGVIGIISAIVFSTIPSSDTSGNASIPLGKFIHEGILILRDDHGFRWFCGGIFLFGFANFLVQPAYTIYKVNIGVDTEWEGIFNVATSGMMILSYVLWGGYIDKRRPEKVIAIQSLVWSTLPLMYCFATKPVMILPVAIVGGIINAGVELAYLNGVMYFAPDDRYNQYQAVFLTLVGLRGIIAPFLGAWLLNVDWVPMKVLFVASAILIALSALIQMIGMRKYDSIKNVVS